MLSYALFGAFQLLALARYPQTPDWGRVVTWAYALFIASVLAIGLYGWLRARPANQHAAFRRYCES